MEEALARIDKECQNGVSGTHMEIIATPPGVDTTQWVMAVSAHDAQRAIALYKSKFGKGGCGCLNKTINVGNISWDWDCPCGNCKTRARNLSPPEYASRLEAHVRNEKPSLRVANEHFRASFKVVSHVISEHNACIDTDLEGFFTHLVVFGTTFSLIKPDFDLAPLVSLRHLLHRIYSVHDIESGSVENQKIGSDDFYENSSDEDEASDYNGEYSTGNSSSDEDEDDKGMDIDSE